MPVILQDPEPPTEHLPGANQVKIVELRILPVQKQVLLVCTWQHEDEDGVVTRLRDLKHWLRGDAYTAVLTAATQDGEPLGVAIKRVAYDRLIADGIVAAGTVK